MAIKLGDALLFLGAKRDGLDRDLRKAEEDTRSWTSRVSDGIGIALGGALLGAVSAGIVGVARLGQNMIQFSADSRQAVRNLQSELGTTTDQAEILGQVAKRVWADNFTANIQDAAAAVGLARRAFRDLSAQELQSVTAVGLAISDTYGAQYERVIDSAASLMADFGLTSQEALDFVAAGYQRGLDRSGDFLESITEYSPQFATAGASAAQFFSTLETGLQGGVLGTDKAADMFKEFRVRILDGSEATRTALGQIGLDADQVTAQLGSGAITVADAFSIVQDRLRNTDDQAVQLQAGVGLLGTQFEDLGAAALEIDPLNTTMEELAGAADATAVRYTSLSGLVQGMGRRLQVALEPAVGVFLDMANEAGPAVEAMFGRLEANASTFAAGFAAVIRGVAGVLRQLWRTIRGDSGEELGATATEAGAWGRNIVIQLARGMASAISAVVSVIQAIGQTIAGWLRPGSPPKILPDIDKWGTAAIQEWIGGMLSADVSGLRGLGDQIMGTLGNIGGGAAVALFNQISGSVEGLFRSFAEEDDTDLIGRIMGSRAAIAQALRDIENVGQVGTAAYEALQASLAPLPDVALDYVEAMLQAAQAQEAVRQAQENLNQVTEEYEAQLAPISAELRAIQDARANRSDEQRIAQLQAALARGRLSDEEKILAQEEIRERQLRIRERALQAAQAQAEAAAQAEVEAAEEAQDAAAEELDLQEELLRAQEENQGLVQNQIQLLDRLAEALENVAGAAGGIGGGGLGEDLAGLGGLTPGGINFPDPGEIPNPLEGLGDDLDLEGLQAEIADIFGPLQTQIDELGGTFEGITGEGGIFDNLGQRLQELKDQYLEPVRQAILILGAAFVGAQIGGAIAGIAAAIGGLSGAGGVFGAISAAVAALGGPLVVLAALIAALAAAWSTDFLGMQTTITGLWDLMREIFRLIWERAEEMGQHIEEALLKVREWFITKVPAALDTLKEKARLAMENVQEKIKGLADTAAEKLEPFRTLIRETIPAAWEEFKGAIQGVLDTVGGRISSFVSGPLDSIRGAFESISGAVERVLGWISDLAEGLGNIPIPEWLESHSPPPLADAFGYINEGIREMTQSRLPALAAGLRALPEPDLGGLAGAAEAVGAGGGGEGGVLDPAPRVTIGQITITDRGAADVLLAFLRGEVADLDLVSFGGYTG